MLLNDLDLSVSKQYYCWCLSQRRPIVVWSVTETWIYQTSTLLGDFKPRVADKSAWWKWGLCKYRWCRYSTAMTLCNQHETFRSINLVFCRFPDIILHLLFKRSRRFSAPRLGCDGNPTSGTNCCSCFCGNHSTVTITYTRVQSAQQFSEIKTNYAWSVSVFMSSRFVFGDPRQVHHFIFVFPRLIVYLWWTRAVFLW